MQEDTFLSLYDALLILYPQNYRAHDGAEMRVLARDLFRQSTCQQKPKIVFHILSDTFNNALEAQLSVFLNSSHKIIISRFELIQELPLSVKISFILLLPFTIIASIEGILRIVFYRPDFLRHLYQTPIYSNLVFTLITVIAPLVVILINSTAILWQQRKKITHNNFDIPLSLSLYALFALSLVFFHDAGPCINHLTDFKTASDILECVQDV